MFKKIGLIVVSSAIMAVPFFASADVLNRQLSVGMSGSDVSALQAFLAADPSIYPAGLVTGFFGALTSSAVSQFQARNGLPAVGRVGPLTLALLNTRMSSGASAPFISAVAVSTNSNSATVSWNTNEAAKGFVYFSANPLSTYENMHSVTVSNAQTAMTDTNFDTLQNVSVQGLSANTTYYYMIYTTDQTGNVSVSWPSTFHTTN